MAIKKDNEVVDFLLWAGQRISKAHAEKIHRDKEAKFKEDMARKSEKDQELGRYWQEEAWYDDNNTVIGKTITPINDVLEHDLTPDCRCDPHLYEDDNGIAIIEHRAFDDRTPYSEVAMYYNS